MGVICDILVGFIEKNSDEATVEKIKSRAGMPGRSFAWHEIVKEEDWQRLLKAAGEELGVEASVAEQMFAEHSIGILTDKFGSFFRISSTPLDLLRKVAKIHLDFPSSMGMRTRKKLELAVDAPDRLIYHYRSPNRLCVFLKALAVKVFEHYGENQYAITETQCMKEGAEWCEIVMSVERVANQRKRPETPAEMS